MKLYAAIMLGGALGSALRFALTSWIAEKTGEAFPWGTLAVNAIGSFAIGLVIALTAPDGPCEISPAARAFLAVGILGGFTTFSTFSLQTVVLAQSGLWLQAAGNVALSVVICLLATAAAMGITSAVLGKL